MLDAIKRIRGVVEAEAERAKAEARGALVRGLVCGVALLMIMVALGLLYLAGFIALAERLGLLGATLAMSGTTLAIALLLLLLSGPLSGAGERRRKAERAKAEREALKRDMASLGGLLALSRSGGGQGGKLGAGHLILIALAAGAIAGFTSRKK